MIEKYIPRTGRTLKENDEIINMANLFEELKNSIEEVNKITNSFGQTALFVDASMIEYRKVFRYSANQTNTIVLTPPSGYKLCVRNISSITESNTGEISIDFVTSNQPVYDHYVSVNSRNNVVGGHIVGAIDEPLTINTTTGANKVSISINYTYHQ